MAYYSIAKILELKLVKMIYHYSGEFSGGNIFVDFNYQSYSWGGKCVVSESIIANHTIMSKFVGGKCAVLY